MTTAKGSNVMPQGVRPGDEAKSRQARAEYQELLALKAKEIPGKIELFQGKLMPVVNADRIGWYRFHNHYDRDGYCDNPGRGY